MMKQETIVAVAVTLTLSAPAFAQVGSLQTCRALDDKIERYQDLRRKGGKASQMDKWKRQLRASESRFRELECDDHGDEL
ncbi:MAG: hypothetical protein Hals2KO_18000 [Halioglobus sp.]